MKRRVGIVSIALGILVILGSVIWVLEVANGPGTGPKTFAQRRSYNQVKESLHESFPLGFGVAMVGLALVFVGRRLVVREGETQA